MDNAMSKLYALLIANPRLIEAYRGAVPCALLSALEIEDDEIVSR
jgi:hypothetical protein